MSCTVGGCDGKHYAKGYCSKHYMRNYKYGSPYITLVDNYDTKARREALKRIMARRLAKNEL
ncbi:hypothetical protein LCGC14_3049580, partial [marine sediment metagenome]